MPNARHIFTATLLIMASLTYGTARSSELETLLMPGKVSGAHAKIEAQCSQCHDRADRSRQAALCQACHKEVAADVRARTGFHGRLAGIDRSQCKACHTEHRGREADIVKLTRPAFDHSLTDFVLSGVHATADCGDCHERGRKFRDASSRCVDCHRAADAHAGKLGTDCAACHEPAGWRSTRFDHERTGFSLGDAHGEVACASCHFGNRYAGTPTQCAACHAPDDVHRGSRGLDCAGCHSTVAWKGDRYDHAKQTGFALAGAHASVDCRACHRTASLEDPLPRDCAGCHRADDVHATRLGAACEKCHKSSGWKPASFDHVRDGRFELVGAHARLTCHACHTAPVAQQKLGTDCNGCHRTRDVHAGRLGKDCAQCHEVGNWREDIAFDHDLGSFPLVGLHVAVPCHQCHVSPSFKGEARDCNGCHQRDDRHRGGLGKECEACHSPSGWGIWEFDHSKATAFALTGAHARAACDGCHRQPPDVVKLSQDCGSCHLPDDVHLGQFGRQCQRCHGTTSFKGARLQ